MNAGGPDLSGHWTGVYFYPDDNLYNANDDNPPTPFTAELLDDHGVVSGSTLEPDLAGPVAGGEVRALIEGSRTSAELRFTKYPDSPRQDPIHYTGLVSADGNAVSGDWVIPGEWSGTFRMQRRVAPAAAEVKAEATAAVRG